jgi:membrane protein
VLFYVINLIITILITFFIFAVIFKVLPDARIKWKEVMVGALTTTLFFLLGKVGISYYITKSNIGYIYGPAGSLVVFLLWIYYSSMILYFGAEFTKAFAIQNGAEISPAEYAVTVEQVEVENGKTPVKGKDNNPNSDPNAQN